MILNLRSKNTLCNKFQRDQSSILPKMQISTLLHFWIHLNVTSCYASSIRPFYCREGRFACVLIFLWVTSMPMFKQACVEFYNWLSLLFPSGATWQPHFQRKCHALSDLGGASVAAFTWSGWTPSVFACALSKDSVNSCRRRVQRRRTTIPVRAFHVNVKLSL